MNKLSVVALGGNALILSNEKGTYSQQINNVSQTCKALIGLLKSRNIIIAHGNGPQVGNILLQNDAGKQVYGVEAMPLDYCVAQTQGSIGYLLDMCLRNILIENNIDRNVITLLTQVKVDEYDKGFMYPTKPVGPYFTKEQAETDNKANGTLYQEDSKGRGWRKVVASPIPLKIENIDIIKQLASLGNIVICAGGGGIPVVEHNKLLQGVEAVIDKDLASAVTAVQSGAEEFYILTDIEKVYINFNTPNQKALDTITVSQAKDYLAQGHFAKGSMGPKIQAAIYYIEHGGKQCIITNASTLNEDNCGTRIIR